MGRGRNYTVGERAIVILGIRAGEIPFKINELLKEEQKRLGLSERRVPASSYAMMKTKYLPAMNDKEIWNHIQNPKSLGNLEK
jgi:hypothetical protein